MKTFIKLTINNKVGNIANVSGSINLLSNDRAGSFLTTTILNN